MSSFVLYTSLIASISTGKIYAAKSSIGKVPDEQRLHRDLMKSYESSVRPVINASNTLVVSFKLTLNQIVDLDERTQVLTTNVFIDQHWTDEKLCWNTSQYNEIRTLRIPANEVWLPDTFIFNNADDGSTGFMQGVYVLLNANGSILWPVPVKLKSSCKVDIRYFPFDDQECLLRFGSWIYSGRWMEFYSPADGIDLTHYIDNSEWELVDIKFEKTLRMRPFGTSSATESVYHNGTFYDAEDYHPDLVYTLHIRRRTFYYIFNIIVPCVMLSVLTLLTFWLPPTSGEKISLGLSVFLAFSMFMLLIAEEVPATSESVPLIGVYLTTVMTLTSTSVIMAVMVINLYNRGGKTTHPPLWAQSLVLGGIAKLFCMSFDIEKLAKGLEMSDTEKARFKCSIHPQKTKSRMATPQTSKPPSRRNTGSGPSLFHRAPSFAPYDGGESSRSTLAVPNEIFFHDVSTRLTRPHRDNGNNAGKISDDAISVHNSMAEENEVVEEDEEDEEEEEIWVRRESQKIKKPAPVQEEVPLRRMSHGHLPGDVSCKKLVAMADRKKVIVEWQSIATVIDRILFWIFLIGTVAAYIFVLILVPNSKPKYNSDNARTRVLYKVSS